ncbi:Uncharacterised protein [Mycobacteroides abscessus subsp. abscessus]|nr:Uncharacterised protein [Mycobacteroides abscessus subsp. abscessus]
MRSSAFRPKGAAVFGFGAYCGKSLLEISSLMRSPVRNW